MDKICLQKGFKCHSGIQFLLAFFTEHVKFPLPKLKKNFIPKKFKSIFPSFFHVLFKRSNFF
jgi:hypothetical protein